MDKDGYLQLTIEDIAFQSGQDFDVVERALQRIQELDPPGVGARDLRECLLLQLRAQGHGGLARRARSCAITCRCSKASATTRSPRSSGVPVEEVVAAANYIATLEPKPGRNFGEGDIRYITPDVFVQKIGDEYVVTLNDEGLPRLRVSSSTARCWATTDSSDAKRYIQEKMRAAAWLIKSIQQRQRTLYHGDAEHRQVPARVPRPRHLPPEAAGAEGRGDGHRHARVDGQPRHGQQVRAHAAGHLRAQVLLHLEPDRAPTATRCRRRASRTASARSSPARIARQPLSDQHIAEMLAKENVDIARRTVAKYREMMGILPSSKRRQVF